MTKVLVTNDDGIDAKGIRALITALTPMADVYVVAPAEEQSAKSQSITFLHSVKVEERIIEGACAAYAAWGTPADCVKIGLCIMEKKGIRPDYVISGINLGYNTGLAAYYSGTVAAAREGALNGYKSIALSSGSHNAGEFDYILGSLPMLMEMAGNVEPGVFINVNAPDLPSAEIQGCKIVETAPFGYGITFPFIEESEGVYHITGAEAGINEDKMYDIDANEDNYMSVSPIPTSMADPESLKRLLDVAEHSD